MSGKTNPEKNEKASEPVNETENDKKNGAETPETAEAAPSSGDGSPETDAPRDDSAGNAADGDAEAFTFTREQVEKMEQAAKQLETVKDQYVRLTAEYDNYRKRTAREKEGLWQDAKADTIKAFLPVYDNLERAVSQAGSDDSPHKKGLELIFQQYRDVLNKLGVSEIAAQGQPFDPDRHNAVQHIEDEKLGENTVAQVFQSGFTLGDKVIRHAMVVVAN